MLHENFQECEPVHARHLQIQRDDVGLQREDFFPGLVGVGSESAHLKCGIAGERIGDGAAGEGRIVDDDNTYLFFDAHGSR